MENLIQKIRALKVPSREIDELIRLQLWSCCYYIEVGKVIFHGGGYEDDDHHPVHDANSELTASLDAALCLFEERERLERLRTADIRIASTAHSFEFSGLPFYQTIQKLINEVLIMKLESLPTTPGSDR